MTVQDRTRLIGQLKPFDIEGLAAMRGLLFYRCTTNWATNTSLYLSAEWDLLLAVSRSKACV